ncbi:MAG: hypothetical protein KGI93_07105, partial [Acidobacteriota bacterium]|nr:hypothetical protein [Acidobacteriota bacterium]
MTRLLRNERGQALPMALAIMTIFGILTAAITINGAANDRSSLKSADARQAFELAQSALAYGEGAVYAATTAPPTSLQTIPAQSGGGTGTYQINPISGSCSCTWFITATGTVDGVSRTITAIATGASSKTVTNSGVWNYVYADAAGTTCATSWNGSVTISVPILVRGDLCLSGSVNYTGSQLQVGGNLNVTGSARIGSASSKISQLQVGLSSTSTSTCNGVTPGTGVCDGSHSPIYAASVGQGIAVTPQMPCIGQPSSWDSQCTGSNDGTWSTLTSVYNTQAGL